jgi:uncharacterized protein
VATIQVEVAYALPEQAWRVPLTLPAQATVAEALAAAAMPGRIPGLVVDPERLAVFGRRVLPDEVLHDGDRVEILRPLSADPMQARRRRARENPAKR